MRVRSLYNALGVFVFMGSCLFIIVDLLLSLDAKAIGRRTDDRLLLPPGREHSGEVSCFFIRFYCTARGAGPIPAKIFKAFSTPSVGSRILTSSLYFPDRMGARLWAEYDATPADTSFCRKKEMFRCRGTG